MLLQGDSAAGSVEEFRFSITRWGAWAPGLESPEAWHRWARGEAVIASHGEPKAAALPPMLRRRTGRLGRMALEAALQCDPGSGLPAVFCSRHGDVGRTLELLEAQARDERVSPAAFGLSVHNAIGGLLSIATGSQATMTAIAAGIATVPAGILEACGLLAEGSPDVLLVAYDEPLPALYAEFRDDAEVPYAWAWRMAQADGPSYTLTTETSEEPGEAAPPVEPLGLELLRCFLVGTETRQLRRGGQAWRWRRHG
jgi:hypothetical protein